MVGDNTRHPSWLLTSGGGSLWEPPNVKTDLRWTDDYIEKMLLWL